MDFQRGVRYERPPAEPASWFHEVLGQVRHDKVGAIPIRIEILGAEVGSGTEGHLEGVENPPMGVQGGVTLDVGERDLLNIPCEDIAAFTLINNEPPIDHTDEIGRS